MVKPLSEKPNFFSIQTRPVSPERVFCCIHSFRVSCSFFLPVHPPLRWRWPSSTFFFLPFLVLILVSHQGSRFLLPPGFALYQTSPSHRPFFCHIAISTVLFFNRKLINNFFGAFPTPDPLSGISLDCINPLSFLLPRFHGCSPHVPTPLLVFETTLQDDRRSTYQPLPSLPVLHF